MEMLTYESEDEFGDTIRNIREAMNILADYVREISEEVKLIAQGDLTRNGDEITEFLGDFSELKDSLLYILKRFNSTLSDISNIAGQVSVNATEVENASKSLSCLLYTSRHSGQEPDPFCSSFWRRQVLLPCLVD